METIDPNETPEGRATADEPEPARVETVSEADLEPTDAADHDDDQDTDHLARLADPDVAQRVEDLEREQGGQRYGDQPTEGGEPDAPDSD